MRPGERLGRRPPDAAARRITHVRQDVVGIEILDATSSTTPTTGGSSPSKDVRLHQALGIRTVDRCDPATTLGTMWHIAVGRGEPEPVAMQVLAQRNVDK